MAPNIRDTTQDNENLIQEENAMKIGKKEVLYDGYFYDVTNFIDRHPGGYVIEYYTNTGEDATVPIMMFHHRSKKKVDAIMNTLPKRPALEHEINVGSDAKSRERYKNMTNDFHHLLNEAEEEGLFKPVYFRNVLVVIEVTLTMFLGGYIVMRNDAFLWKALGAIITGIGMGRMGLLQHECGHNSVTGNPKTDKFLQNIFYGFYMGMSSQWWVRRHNRHHAMPQRFQRDFDMEHLPVTAVHEDFVYDPQNISQNNVLTRNQGFLLPLNGTLFICAINFYYHPHYIFKRRLWNEMIALLLHFGIAFSTVGVWPYMLAKSFMSLYLSSSFALNHTHLPITYESKHWVEFGLLHTANITPGWFNDWWLILLNYQIEHHLFPTMPQYNLRFVAERVKKLAAKYDLKYNIESLPRSYMNTLGHVFHVQDHVRKINKEAKAK